LATFAEALQIARRHREAGRPDLARLVYLKILEARPEQPDTLHDLAILARHEGQPAEALGYLRRAIAADAGRAEFHNTLGVIELQEGRQEAAVACFRRACELRPTFPDPHNNLGFCWYRDGRLDEALTQFRRALQLDPGYAAAWVNLGLTLRAQGKLQAAAECFEYVLASQPDNMVPLLNLATTRYAQGQVDAALDCVRRAILADPYHAESHSCYLNLLQYRPGVTPEELLAEHLEYDRRHAAAWHATEPQHVAPSEAHRRLRVGFVSSNLATDAVGHFLVPTLENLDPQRCFTVCYSDTVRSDAMTGRLRAAAGLWRETATLSDEGLAEQIRTDRIDILFDLAGHTGGNRLLVFARKPAPIQITWLDYVGTTGLAAMDYLLADRYEVPPGAEQFYRERVLRMPDDYVCFDPPREAPQVGPLPALATGRVTFGCLAFPAKVNDVVVGVWARILAAVPNSRLLLKHPGMNDSATGGRLREAFAASGIAGERILLESGAPRAEFLAAYQRIDVALDTFPYNGGLTTCEALWMGVPVVTCPGRTFAGRHALSHLSNVGLRETIAANLDRYVELAVRLAGDLPYLAELRAGLRQRVAQSPLCDGRRFADNLLALLRSLPQ
jgi:predicted O-linked N-acetylglucosamine transferase (SPINDLY family)